MVETATTPVSMTVEELLAWAADDERRWQLVDGVPLSNLWTYTSKPSVREILILRSTRFGARLLRRVADCTWPADPDWRESGSLVLKSIGLTMPLEGIYRTSGLVG